MSVFTLTNRLICSRIPRKWNVAQHILRHREVSLERRLELATTAYHRARIESQLATVIKYYEYIAENWGCLYGDSAADCNDWSNRQYAIGEWESRHLEKYPGDRY